MSFKIGIMQGRLSKPVDGKIQSFPRDHWKDEFYLGKQIGFELIEWVLDKAFITSTPFCVLPAVKLNGLKIGDGKVGKLTKKLLKEWSNLVGVDIVKQIKSWDLKKNKGGTTPYKFSNNSTLTMAIEEN